MGGPEAEGYEGGVALAEDGLAEGVQAVVCREIRW